MINYKLISVIIIAGILLGNLYILVLIAPALISRLIASAVIYSVKEQYKDFDNKFKKQALNRGMDELNSYLVIKVLAGLSHVGIIISSCYIIYLIGVKFFGAANLIKFAMM